MVTFLVAVFFTGAGGSLGFIAAVRVARVVVAGVGSVGVFAFERVALVAIVVVDVVGFGKREAILCTRFGRFAVVCQSRRDASQVTFRLFREPTTACQPSAVGTLLDLPILVSQAWSPRQNSRRPGAGPSLF